MTTVVRLFGTDGIRGPAGVPPLDQETLIRFGRTLGRYLQTRTNRPVVLLGGDTRESTPAICQALATGLQQLGCETRFGGVLPTPAVARLTKELSCAAGIAVSASHNPHPDNGVKLLDPTGRKWTREAETELEELFKSEAPAETDRLEGLRVESELAQRYLDSISSLFEHKPLADLHFVLDSAHGAASGLAQEFFERLGARVVPLGIEPTGKNINSDCGSTHPELAQQRVVEVGANAGFTFDGDADRVIAIDEHGQVRDGDAQLYALATYYKNRHELDPPRLVATSMSNLGLEAALSKEAIELVRCDVGDRAVVETLEREGLVLGGEQSGHIVHLDLAATGDGLVSAALLARVMAESGRTLSSLLEPFRRFPQILRNVPVRAKPSFESLPEVNTEARRIEDRLGDEGRLVLRYSGTEKLARVMIEGRDQAEIERMAEDLASVVAKCIGTVPGSTSSASSAGSTGSAGSA